MAKATKKRAVQKAFVHDAFVTSLDKAALEYRNIRDSRMELNKQEAKLKEKLLGLMTKEKLRKYKTKEGLLVQLHDQPAETTVKVSTGGGKKKVAKKATKKSAPRK